ncbi:winged helix-turn-helix transcriptional regulator [Halorubrum ejinorense]|uniref:Winged helix-turn-helix transcriptional regulator n=1 Tax=Halorubrum ejinorense TaxID=425309 RepID=A0AAV3SQE7_9EURY
MSNTYAPAPSEHSDNESSTERTLLRTSIARRLTGEDDEFGSVKVISHELADRVFTPKRREILQTLNQKEVSSQRELARILDRDPGAVQRDLTELINADLVDVVEEGRSKRPVLAHDTIIAEPLVAPSGIGTEASYTVENEP